MYRDIPTGNILDRKSMGFKEFIMFVEYGAFAALL